MQLSLAAFLGPQEDFWCDLITLALDRATLKLPSASTPRILVRESQGLSESKSGCQSARAVDRLTCLLKLPYQLQVDKARTTGDLRVGT